MTCRQIAELITDYLEGALSAGDRLRFEEHVAGCEACSAYLGQLRATTRVLTRLREEEIPENLRSELLAAFRSWKS